MGYKFDHRVLTTLHLYNVQNAAVSMDQRKCGVTLMTFGGLHLRAYCMHMAFVVVHL